MSSRITSLHNRRVRNAVRLRRRRARQQQGRIIIDGPRELARAVEAGVELEELFVCPPFGQAQADRQLTDRLARDKVQIHEVVPDVMDRLAFGNRRDGVVGVARTPTRTLAGIELPARPLVVVLEGVEKPGNVGAVVRTSDAAGADAVVLCDGGTDLFNPNTIRASLGTVFSQPVATASTPETLDWLTRVARGVLVARVDAHMDYAEADYTGSVAVVLGNEAAGLSAAWQGAAIRGIRIPMQGTADSLNVSAAAAVLLYEARRQRRAASRACGD